MLAKQATYGTVKQASQVICVYWVLIKWVSTNFKKRQNKAYHQISTDTTAISTKIMIPGTKIHISTKNICQM